MADRFSGRRPFNQQPMAQQPVNPLLQGFKPDFQVIIKMESSTGRTVIESANGIPINPLTLTSVCLSIAKGQVDNIIAQQSMLIKLPSTNTPPEETPSDKSTSNGEIDKNGDLQ